MQRTDPTPWTMNAKQARLVFMKIQIIQARLPAFAERKLDTTDFWSKSQYGQITFLMFLPFLVIQTHFSGSASQTESTNCYWWWKFKWWLSLSHGFLSFYIMLQNPILCFIFGFQSKLIFWKLIISPSFPVCQEGHSLISPYQILRETPGEKCWTTASLL